MYVGPEVNGASLDLCNIMAFHNADRYLQGKVQRKQRNHSNGGILPLQLLTGYLHCWAEFWGSCQCR